MTRRMRGPPCGALTLQLLLALCLFKTSTAALLAWYPCNDTANSATLKDYSPNGYHGTCYNSPTFNGQYMELTKASSEYVRAASGLATALGSSTNWAAAFWVYAKTADMYARVFDFGSSTNTYFYLTMFHVASDMAFEITLSGTQQFTKASGTLSTSTWYHVAVSYSSASQKATLYINGAAATMSRQDTMTYNPSSLGTASNPYIGRSQYTTDPYFNGYLMDIMFFSHTLSATDVFRIYAKTSTPTMVPTRSPTRTPTMPTRAPTQPPTTAPTVAPTTAPSVAPTVLPTTRPTQLPTMPTKAPTAGPTRMPTLVPTSAPTAAPTKSPTKAPTARPTLEPTRPPTLEPTAPTIQPTGVPTPLPTTGPTPAPTRLPTPPPTAMPTVQPTALVCSLLLLSPYAQRGTSVLPVVNPSQPLSIRASCNTVAKGTWTSPNASVTAYIASKSQHSVPSSYLFLGSSALAVPSSLYLIRWAHSGTPGVQLAVLVNSAPQPGNITISPLNGISLATNFTLHATGWSDPEADLPLTYTYYANSLLLDEGLESPALRTYLPPVTTNLTLALEVMDALGATAAFSRVIANTITAPSGANASAAIRSLSRSINSTGLVRSVALAAMVSSGIGSSKNRTLINQQGLGLLGVLGSALVAYPDDTVTRAIAATATAAIGAITTAVSNLGAGAGRSSEALMYKALDTLDGYSTRLVSVSDGSAQTIGGDAMARLGNGVLGVLTDLLGLGLLSGPSCTTRRPTDRIDRILQSLGVSAAEGLTPGGSPVSYSTTTLGLHVSRHSYRMQGDGAGPNFTVTAQALNGLASNFTLPASVLYGQRAQLCGDGAFALQAVSWTFDKYGCYASRNDSSRSRQVSPHVASLDVLRSCTNASESSRRFSSSPVRLDVRHAGRPITIRLPVAAGGTLGDGLCVFWNATLKDWSGQGCTRVPDPSAVVCECTHLSDFSHTPDTPVIRPLAIPRRGSPHSIYYPLLMGIAVLYLAFGMSLAVARAASPTRKWAYLDLVPSTRMYASLLRGGPADDERKGMPPYSLVARNPDGKFEGVAHDPEEVLVLANEVRDKRLQRVEALSEILNRRWSWSPPKPKRMVSSTTSPLAKEGARAQEAADEQRAKPRRKGVRSRHRRQRRSQVSSTGDNSMASEASQGGEARHEASGVEQEQGERQEQEEGLKGEGDDQEDQDAIQTQLLETLKDTQVADGDEASPSQTGRCWSGNEGATLRMTRAARPDECLRLATNRLTAVQRVLRRVLSAITQLMLALAFASWWSREAWVRPFLHRGLWLQLAVPLVVGALAQALAAEVVSQVATLLLIVLRQEWAARHMVEEAVLGWDQELCYLQGGDKPLLGPVFVPMLRVGIIQTDLALQHIEAASRRKDKPELVDPGVLRSIRATYSMLQRLLSREYQVYYRARWYRFGIRRGWTAYLLDKTGHWSVCACQPPPEFRRDPLELLDLGSKVARLYDSWARECVLTGVCRWYYDLLLADPRHHVVGEEALMASVRRQRCTWAIAGYAAAITGALLVLALEASEAAAIAAAIGLALGLALQVLLVSPFITVVVEGIGSQAREDIRQALTDKHDRFLPYFEDAGAELKRDHMIIRRLNRSNRQGTFLDRAMSTMNGLGRSLTARLAQVAPAPDEDPRPESQSEALWAAQILGGFDEAPVEEAEAVAEEVDEVESVPGSTSSESGDGGNSSSDTSSDADDDSEEEQLQEQLGVPLQSPWARGHKLNIHGSDDVDQEFEDEDEEPPAKARASTAAPAPAADVVVEDIAEDTPPAVVVQGIKPSTEVAIEAPPSMPSRRSSRVASFVRVDRRSSSARKVAAPTVPDVADLVEEELDTAA